MAKKRLDKKKKTRILISVITVVLLSAAAIGYDFYKKVYTPNISEWENDEKFLYIPTGSTFNDLMKILVNEGVLVDQASFEWVAERMGLKAKVRPGKYKVTRGMNNKELVSLLRSGKQVPVRITFENIRTTPQLAGIVSRQIEADSATLANLMSDDSFMGTYGFTSITAPAFFIPNTYEFYWNTSAKEFMERMAKEYKSFWTATRKSKAEKAGLTQTEVAVFASIVDQETRKNDEKPIIAGVYLNRFRKGWKLEADPTLVFAAGDFTIQRVLNIHKEIDSPYNTYMYPGLPPGPICIPSISGIDAVLNYKKHDFMFFCAREDFSGYHSFAVTYSQHLANARRFQRELDRRNIRS